MPQERLISAVRDRSERDDRVLAVLMYGSFAKGEGDQFSDVEFYIFVADEALGSLNHRDWVSALAPVSSFFVNEFGTDVAIFEDLIRGEFHFEPHSTVGLVQSWTSIESIGSTEDMLVLDRVGELTSNLRSLRRADLTGELIQDIYDRLLNWFLLGCNVLKRGERARALDALARTHSFLLQLARARMGALEHWLTPSRNLERELGRSEYETFCSCTGSLSPGSLEVAYRNTWAWSQELVAGLSRSWDVDSRHELTEKIEARLSGWLSP